MNKKEFQRRLKRGLGLWSRFSINPFQKPKPKGQKNTGAIAPQAEKPLNPKQQLLQPQTPNPTSNSTLRVLTHWGTSKCRISETPKRSKGSP